MTKIYKLFCLLLLFSSCATKNGVMYLQENIDVSKNQVISNNVSIKKGDILNINVSALDMTSIAPFIKNINNNYSNIDQRKIEGYKVDEEGKINLPFIGKITVENLTTENAAEKIENELKKNIIDPVVNITILTYQITVLGEVNQPGTYTILDPKINILQILGTAGDITINGKRKGIILIREVNNKIIKKEIDITKSELLYSDYYHLNNNDVLYVPPTFARIKNSGYIGSINNIATVFSLLISIIILAQSN